MALVISLTMSPALMAAGLEESMRMATDAHSDRLFLLNPAIPRLNKTSLQVGLQAGARRVKVKGSPGTGNQENLVYDTQVREQGAGFLVPIADGASVGGVAQYIGRDLTARGGDNADAQEHASFRKYEGRFVLGLSDELRFGFAYRYLMIKQDILGSFDVGEEDRTRYKGIMTGYSAGFFYDTSLWGLGIAYVPAMRGKSEISGEQKILTEPGQTVVDGYMNVSKRVTVGLGLQKWLHKRDDRQEVSTSLEDQRTISLYGLDLEQFFFKTQAMTIGADVAVYPELLLKLSLYRQEGVFLSQDHALPGGKSDSETRMAYHGAQVALNFQRRGFAMEFGFRRDERSLASFKDQRSVFGHGRYGSYKATETGGYLSLGFTP